MLSGFSGAVSDNFQILLLLAVVQSAGEGDKILCCFGFSGGVFGDPRGAAAADENFRDANDSQSHDRDANDSQSHDRDANDSQSQGSAATRMRWALDDR